MMLALIALVIFICILLGVTFGTIDMVVLGLAFVAAHLAFGVPLNPSGWRRRE